MAKYKTVAFQPMITQKELNKDGSTATARQLQKLIEEEAGRGWHYLRYEPIQATVNNGCLAAFSGKPFSQVTHGVVVFERRD